jgi:chromosome segregation ATPase
LKIRSLRLEQFKKFDRAVVVETFGDGLNLISGPNETGKSTLLLALRAVLFERHGSKAQSVKDLAPHHVKGAKPTVTLDFDIQDGRYRLEKRFLSRPMARLEAPGGQRFEGADAEAELARLLSLPPSGKTSADKDGPAHFGILLTPQTRSFQQPVIEAGTRHSLEAAIAAEIAELGNQSDVDALLSEIDTKLFAFVSRRGEPKNRYKDVETSLGDIQGEIAAARQERDALETQVTELERAIAKRNSLARADDNDDVSKRLAVLEAGRTEAVQRQAMENRRLAAEQDLRQLEGRRDRYEARQRLAHELAEIDGKQEKLAQNLALLEQSLADHDQALSDLNDQRSLLEERRQGLERLGRDLERERHIEATLSALATEVRLELNDDGLERLTINGERLGRHEHKVQVTEGLTIEVEDVGRIDVLPKTEPMREALEAKAEVETTIAHLVRDLDLGGSDPERVESSWQMVAAEIEAIDQARSERKLLLQEERQAAADAKASLTSLAAYRTQTSRRLTELTDRDDAGKDDEDTCPADLHSRIAEAAATLASIENECRAAQANGKGALPAKSLDQLDDEIERLRSEIEIRRQQKEAVGREVLRLEAAIAVRAGLGLDEKIDQLERREQLLKRERDGFRQDHQALALLKKTLSEAANEAKASFNAPLSKRLTPYIKSLFPNATPLVKPDFSISALDREGIEEPFGQLSDGTREQIAILVRLAFADMLKEQGLPAIIVLDDALAFSDDDRLGRMFDILKAAAKRMQIIVLTCRDHPLADIEATRLEIAPDSERTVSAA